MSPSPSLLRREVQKGHHSHSPFWTQCIPLRALDTQAANKPSRSFRNATGGLFMACDTSQLVRACSVSPYPKLHITYLTERYTFRSCPWRGVLSRIHPACQTLTFRALLIPHTCTGTQYSLKTPHSCTSASCLL